MEPETTKPSKEEIHRELRERIILLDLAPGSRMREERLAAHYGVSRTPIRQILDRLEFEGLVEQVPGAGARVSSVDMRGLRDVWAVRLKIAELVAEFVRLPAPPEVMARTRGIRKKLDGVKRTRDLKALGSLYNEYHEALLDIIENKTMVTIHDQLYVQTARVWMQFLPEMDLDSEIEIMADEIDQTLLALAESSGSWLAGIRVKHMRMLLDRFNENLTRPLI